MIGFPLSHSFSKKYFTEKFLKEHVSDCRYENYELNDINELNIVLQNNPGLAGINITIPYKESVMEILDSIDEKALWIGAVNTVKITRRNNKIHLKGFNTDYIGFEKSIINLLKPVHKNALILGTGGASKAIAFVLKNHGIAVTFVSRQTNEDAIKYEDLSDKIISEHKIIINCTPLGMVPFIDSFPDIPYKFLSAQHLLFDLIYNPPETVFLKKGKENGAIIKNGYEMLFLQAEAAWQIWNQLE